MNLGTIEYVGTEHSKNFAMNNLTLEEYLHIN